MYILGLMVAFIVIYVLIVPYLPERVRTHLELIEWIERIIELIQFWK